MKLIKNQKGQGLTEYIILLVLVSLVSVLAATGLGANIKKKIKKASEHINSDINFKEVNKP
jgi:Flp pilus assembly pilin Flp